MSVELSKADAESKALATKNRGMPAHFSVFPPVSHDLKQIKSIMREQDNVGFERIKAASRYGQMDWSEARKALAKAKFIEIAAMGVSSIPLLLTSIIYFASPIILGESEIKNPLFDNALLGSFLLVAFFATVAIDLGRSHVITHNPMGFNIFGLYCFLTVLSVVLSGLGLAAVAYWYNSADMKDTKAQLQQSRAALIQGGSNRSIEAIRADLEANAKRYHTRGSGWGRSAYQDEKKRLETELAQVQAQSGAKNALDNKNAILGTVDSSNVLGNIMAMISNLNANQGIVVAALMFVLGAEVTLFYIVSKIKLLRYRIELTKSQYYAACHVADRIAIASTATLEQYDQRIAAFIHQLGTTPIELAGRLNTGQNWSDLDGQHQHPHTTHRRQTPNSTLDHLLQKKAAAKAKRFGETAICPTCDEPFIKTNSAQIFCCKEHKRDFEQMVKQY
jgi:hypothetical protein